MRTLSLLLLCCALISVPVVAQAHTLALAVAEGVTTGAYDPDCDKPAGVIEEWGRDVDAVQDHGCAQALAAFARGVAEGVVTTGALMALAAAASYAAPALVAAVQPWLIPVLIGAAAVALMVNGMPELSCEGIARFLGDLVGGLGTAGLFSLGKALVRRMLAGGPGTGDDIARIMREAFKDGVCFVGGTLVATEQGLRPIEEVNVGDRVWGQADTAAPALSPVVQTHVRTTNVLLDVTTDTEVISTTPEHPFYVEGDGYVAAGSLRPGDVLRTAGGAPALVHAIERREAASRVYNFEVESSHNYYVGASSILVHNSCQATPWKSIQESAEREWAAALAVTNKAARATKMFDAANKFRWAAEAARDAGDGAAEGAYRRAYTAYYQTAQAQLEAGATADAVQSLSHALGTTVRAQGEGGLTKALQSMTTEMGPDATRKALQDRLATITDETLLPKDPVLRAAERRRIATELENIRDAARAMGSSLPGSGAIADSAEAWIEDFL